MATTATEVLLDIFKYLDFPSYLAVTHVCQRWRRVAETPTARKFQIDNLKPYCQDNKNKVNWETWCDYSLRYLQKALFVPYDFYQAATIKNVDLVQNEYGESNNPTFALTTKDEEVIAFNNNDDCELTFSNMFAVEDEDIGDILPESFQLNYDNNTIVLLRGSRDADHTHKCETCDAEICCLEVYEYFLLIYQDVNFPRTNSFWLECGGKVLVIFVALKGLYIYRRLDTLYCIGTDFAVDTSDFSEDVGLEAYWSNLERLSEKDVQTKEKGTNNDTEPESRLDEKKDDQISKEINGEQVLLGVNFNLRGKFSSFPRQSTPYFYGDRTDWSSRRLSGSWHQYDFKKSAAKEKWLWSSNCRISKEVNVYLEDDADIYQYEDEDFDVEPEDDQKVVSVSYHVCSSDAILRNLVLSHNAKFPKNRLVVPSRRFQFETSNIREGYGFDRTFTSRPIRLGYRRLGFIAYEGTWDDHGPSDCWYDEESHGIEVYEFSKSPKQSSNYKLYDMD